MGLLNMNGEWGRLVANGFALTIFDRNFSWDQSYSFSAIHPEGEVVCELCSDVHAS
jgi:hypothetical protein